MLKIAILLIVSGSSAVLGILNDPCEKPCFFLLAPMCASNGQTYPNKCVLDNANCKDNSIKFKHPGKCGEEVNTCIPTVPCPALLDPVCGTNGQNYSNECYLKKEACNNPDLKVDHKGYCDSVTM